MMLNKIYIIYNHRIIKKIYKMQSLLYNIKYIYYIKIRTNCIYRLMMN